MEKKIHCDQIDPKKKYLLLNKFNYFIRKIQT